jgi:hypothetical protein
MGKMRKIEITARKNTLDIRHPPLNYPNLCFCMKWAKVFKIRKSVVIKAKNRLVLGPIKNRIIKRKEICVKKIYFPFARASLNC